MSLELVSLNQELYILHGWAIDPNNRVKWQPFLNQLSKEGIKAHFLNIPGLSTILKRPWTMTEYLDWLQKTLPPKTKISLLGHSFGGHLSLQFAARYPNRLHKLILIDSSGIRDQSLRAKLKRSVFKSAAILGKKITQSSRMRALLYKLAREKDYLQADPIMKQTLVNVVSDDVTKVLPKIKHPTLIIWGKLDRQTPLKFARVLRRQLTNSHLKILSTARHSPQFTHSSKVATFINQFLKS